MKLSIGMIVKNEEKYLERCLNGIKPILDSIDSELIITDTGSSDRTVEIAKQFTENVLHFEWIGDFAAARNTAFEIVRGEWFMFLDADEIFKSCDSIIDFFNTGEYLKYNSASFVIRNHFSSVDSTGNNYYSDFSAPRLTRMRQNTRFVGEVHETLNTYGHPLKRLDDVADHYGYMYTDENMKLAKAKRNVELLYKKLETSSEDEREMLYLQLYECLLNLDPQEAEKYMQLGIDYCIKRKSFVLTAFYSDKAYDCYAKEKYEEVLKVCSDYFSMDKAIRPGALTTDAEMRGYEALTYYNLERYSEALEQFEKYFDVYRQVKSGNLQTSDSLLQTYEIATDRNFIPIFSNFLTCCEHENMFNLAANYMQMMPISKYSVFKEHVAILVPQCFGIMKHFGYESAYKYYSRFDDFGKKLFRESLSVQLFSDENREQLLNAVADIARHDSEMNEKLGIYKDYFSGSKANPEKIRIFSEKYSIIDNVDLFYIVIDCGADVSQLFKAKDFEMKVCVYKCCMSVTGFYNVISTYSVNSIENTDDIPLVVKFTELCMKTIPVYRAKVGKDVPEIDGLFTLYAEMGARYAKEKSKTLDEVSPDMKAAKLASEMNNARSERKFKDCFALMKEAVVTYPAIAPVISEYQKCVTAEFEEFQRNQPVNEMERLALMIKRNIRGAISVGDRDTALKTLEQYRMINPSDPDIEYLINELNE